MKESPWIKAPVANLVRYKPSGIYFARAKIGGKLIRQSLKTHVLSIAKFRLSDLLAAEQKKVDRQKTIAVGKMTVGDAWDSFIENDGKRPRYQAQHKEIPAGNAPRIGKILAGVEDAWT